MVYWNRSLYIYYIITSTASTYNDITYNIYNNIVYMYILYFYIYQ